MSKNKKKVGNSTVPPSNQAEKLKVTHPLSTPQSPVFQNLGNDAFKNHNFEKAKDLYSQAIQLEPNPVFYSNRAVACFELDEFEESLRDAEKALEIDPNFWKVFALPFSSFQILIDFQAYLRKGLALKEMDQYDVYKAIISVIFTSTGCN